VTTAKRIRYRKRMEFIVGGHFLLSKGREILLASGVYGA
jgi:hypothetical protein